MPTYCGIMLWWLPIGSNVQKQFFDYVYLFAMYKPAGLCPGPRARGGNKAVKIAIGPWIVLQADRYYQTSTRLTHTIQVTLTHPLHQESWHQRQQQQQQQQPHSLSSQTSLQNYATKSGKKPYLQEMLRLCTPTKETAGSFNAQKQELLS